MGILFKPSFMDQALICVRTLLLLNKKYKLKMQNSASDGLTKSKALSILGCWGSFFHLTMFIELNWTAEWKYMCMTHWFCLQGWKKISPPGFSSDLFQPPSYAPENA